MMRTEHFEIGDLVWAKMKMFPFWPARIATPPENVEMKEGKNYVFFFGSNDYAWISSENIRHHTSQLIPPNYDKRRSLFKQAVKRIEYLSLLKLQGDNSQEDDSTEESQSDNGEGNISKNTEENEKEEQIKGDEKAVEDKGDEKAVEEGEMKSNEEQKEIVAKGNKKRKLCRRKTKEETGRKIFKVRKSVKTDDLRTLSNHSEIGDTSEETPCSKTHDDTENRDDEQSCSSSHFNLAGDCAASENEMHRKETSLVVNKRQENSGEERYTPTTKKIGFLGLGTMGNEIVKNLLSTGHDVTVWNRTEEKCKECVDAGASSASNPAEVVKKSDIIFSCVSDAQASGTIVYGPDGVLKGFQDCPIETSVLKGYVELTTVDFETSQMISAAIHGKGGKFLEAPIIGTKQLAEKGSLFILAAGNESLFHDCITCFRAIAYHWYYIGENIGDSAKYNVCLSMFMGTSYAALIETLDFSNRMKLDSEELLKVLKKREHASESTIEKGEAFLKRDISEISTTLKHQKKIMSLGLQLSDIYSQPIAVSAAANAFFKTGRFLRYARPDRFRYPE